MNKKKIFLIVQSALCAVITAMLAAGAILIYRDGMAQRAADPLSWIYTREKAASAAFSVIPFTGMGVILTIVGLIKGIRDEHADKPAADIEWMRDQVVSRVAFPNENMKREQAVQKKLRYGGWAAFGLAMVPVIFYITDGAHFPNGNLEPVFIGLLAHTLPWTAVGLGVLMGSSFLQDLSMEREIRAAKEQIRLEKAEGMKPAETGKENARPGRIRFVRTSLLVLAVLMIVAGICNGSAWDVFGKAVKICTECVGLG